MEEGCQRSLVPPRPPLPGAPRLASLENQTWRWKLAPSPLSTLSACSLLAAGSCLFITSLLIIQTLLPNDLCLVVNVFLFHNKSFLSHFLVVQLSSDSCQKQTASRRPHSLRSPRLSCSCTFLTFHFFRVQLSSPNALALFRELMFPLGKGNCFLLGI